MTEAGERILEGAREALAVAKGEQPAASITIYGHTYVPKGARTAIETTINFLTEEFIVEECAGNITEGCLSCEMIGARASLRKALELIEDHPPTP
jgi:hypothetical protein